MGEITEIVDCQGFVNDGNFSILLKTVAWGLK